ncbi:MAG TPA: hypothetical protein DCM08_04550, partial [Microscillaceae bacterium]|nr:hypothetical protein [Microscillaceae bacterium]
WWTLGWWIAAQSLFAQSPKRPFTPFEIDASAHVGFIIDHQENVGHLVGSHPISFNASIYRLTTGDKGWESASFFPKIGVSLHYSDLRSDILGQVVAILPNMKFSWWRMKHGGQLEFKIGTGLAYLSNPWSLDRNFSNTMYSFPLLTAMNFGLIYSQPLTPRWKLRLSAEIYHFSNGAFSLPNAGINTPSVAIGAIYSPNAHKIEWRDSIRPFRQTLYLQAAMRGGVIERNPAQGSKNVVVNADIGIAWRWRRKNILLAGFEYSLNTAIRDLIAEEIPTGSRPDYARLGLVVGHELVAGSVSLLTQLGVYIYRPYDKIDLPLYQRIGLRYYFNDRLFGQFGMKLHLGAAECLEFGVGYNIWKISKD